MYRRLPTVIALLLALSLAAACGGEDEPDPIPSSEPTPEVSVSPPPEDAQELNEEQKAAFDAAAARLADFEDFSSRITADPTGPTTEEIAMELAEYTVMPATKKWSDSLEQLKADGIRIEGQSKLEWRSPEEVTSSRVTLLTCESPGTWTAYQGDQSSPQENNAVTRWKLVYQDDIWLIEDQEEAGEC